MAGIRGEGSVISLDMLIGTTIFLLAFTVVIYLIISTPVGGGSERIEMQHTALRTTDVLIRDSGWYVATGNPNFTSMGPSGSSLQVETVGNQTLENINWEGQWDSSANWNGTRRMGLMGRFDENGPAPGSDTATLENDSFTGVLSVQKVDGEFNGTYGVEGIMIRHPVEALSTGEGDANGTWWWDFGQEASYNVTSAEDDVSDAEYENVTRALGLDERRYDLYVQLRPINASMYNDTAADLAIEQNVPERANVAKFARVVLIIKYDSGNDAWDYVRQSEEQPIWYRLVLYMW